MLRFAQTLFKSMVDLSCHDFYMLLVALDRYIVFFCSGPIYFLEHNSDHEVGVDWLIRS